MAKADHAASVKAPWADTQTIGSRPHMQHKSQMIKRKIFIASKMASNMLIIFYKFVKEKYRVESHPRGALLFI